MKQEDVRNILRAGCAGICLLACALAAPAQQPVTAQRAGTSAIRANPVLTSTAAEVNTARYTRDVQTRVNRSLLDTGKVTAVEDGRRVVITDASLLAHAARNQVFYEIARTAPAIVDVPAILQNGSAPATQPAVATLLREEVIAPTSTGASTRLRTYARDETGLTYVGARNRFEGRFAVALSPVEPGAATLSVPKKISISLPGGALIAPVPELIINELDSWTPVTFSVNQPADPYRVSVSASTDDNSDAVEVKVLRPSLNLATDMRYVPGYGLGTFVLSIAAAGLQEPEGAMITFQADGGMAESGNVVTLDAHGKGTLKMRSVGSGTVIVRVLPPFESASVAVVFTNPWLLLVLAVLGGIAGSIIMRRGRTKWSKVVRVGALTGLAMTVLYYVGLDWVVKATGWTTLASAGEAVAFALGLLGAVVGMGVITGVSKKE